MLTIISCWIAWAVITTGSGNPLNEGKTRSVTPENAHSEQNMRSGFGAPWLAWHGGPCSVSCGLGVFTRKRNCSNDDPQTATETCIGSNTEVYICQETVCPVDGAWTAWSDCGSCSVTCETGSKTQKRWCNAPSPSNGGANCTGNITREVACNEIACPPLQVDGAWTAWADFGSCSVTCEMGSKTQKRWCNAPPPSNGGANCTGNLTREVACNEAACPPPQVWDIRMKTQFIDSAPQVQVLELDLNGTAITIPPPGTCTVYGRGLTIVSVDKNKAIAEQMTCEDTYMDPNGAARLIAFLDTVPIGKIVLCITHDEASWHLGAEFNKYMTANYQTQLLKGIGSRDNWMLIAIKGVGTLHEELEKAVTDANGLVVAPPVEIKAIVTKGSDQIAVTRTI